mmetsp:Transcript_7078/g.13396  ORF Transcript_7078/g.13396 Transcript_7078/m.13396 type:complete len:295 (-) Transcript_7078:83-967(-)
MLFGPETPKPARQLIPYEGEVCNLYCHDSSSIPREWDFPEGPPDPNLSRTRRPCSASQKRLIQSHSVGMLGSQVGRSRPQSAMARFSSNIPSREPTPAFRQQRPFSAFPQQQASQPTLQVEKKKKRKKKKKQPREIQMNPYLAAPYEITHYRSQPRAKPKTIVMPGSKLHESTSEHQRHLMEQKKASFRAFCARELPPPREPFELKMPWGETAYVPPSQFNRKGIRNPGCHVQHPAYGRFTTKQAWRVQEIKHKQDLNTKPTEGVMKALAMQKRAGSGHNGFSRTANGNFWLST